VSGTAMVVFVSALRLEDIWLEVLLDDAVQTDPIKKGKKVHLVQDCVKAKINQEIERIIDGNVPKEHLIL
jgi:hypothetical protein